MAVKGLTGSHDPGQQSSTSCGRSSLACPGKLTWGFPVGASGKEPRASAGDKRSAGLVPGSGRSPGGGQGDPFQYSCVKDAMARGVWWATVRRVTALDMTKVT